VTCLLWQLVGELEGPLQALTSTWPAFRPLGIGTEAIVRAPPDGYTIGMATTTTLATAPVLTPKLTYDPVNDVAPISLVGVSPYVLVAHPGVPARVLQDFVDAEQLTGRGSREKVVQRQHRVGLATAEVRLELYDRIAVLVGKPPHRIREQPLEALGQIRATNELDGLFVLIGALAYMHLPKVRGELGLLVSTAGDVLMRVHDFSPRLQVARRLALDGRARALALLGTQLLVKANAEKLHLDLLDLGRLWGRDRR